MAVLAIFSVSILAGCAGGTDIAKEGQSVLVGMSAEDVQACAGIPTRTKKIDDRTEIFSYEQKNENVGGFNMELPFVGGFKHAGSGAYCTAIFHMVDNKVIGVHYTGDNDDAVGENGVCAPIVRGCVRNPVPDVRPGAAGAMSPVPPSSPAAASPARDR